MNGPLYTSPRRSYFNVYISGFSCKLFCGLDYTTQRCSFENIKNIRYFVKSEVNSIRGTIRKKKLTDSSVFSRLCI